MSSEAKFRRADSLSGFQTAPRVHRAITASAEKRLLLWIARRLPSGINSDHLTALGFVSQVAAGACYALASRNRSMLGLAVICIALNWFGDSLDGTLARVRNQQRPRYGFYVDHMADAFGSIAMMIGLGFSGYLHWPIAMGMLLTFLVLSIESYLTTYTLGSFHLSHGPFGPTEIRILLAIGTVALLFHPHAVLLGRQFLLFDVGGFVAIVGMAIMAIATTARHTRELYRAETLL